MIDKFAKKDGLFFHKVGLILGIVAGFLIGLVVSDRADRFEIEETAATGMEIADNAVTKAKIADNAVERNP